jgi:hypothetical protein
MMAIFSSNKVGMPIWPSYYAAQALRSAAAIAGAD